MYTPIDTLRVIKAVFPRPADFKDLIIPYVNFISFLLELLLRSIQKALETGAEIIEYIEAHEALGLLLMLTRKLNLKHVAPLFLYFSLVFGLEKSK